VTQQSDTQDGGDPEGRGPAGHDPADLFLEHLDFIRKTARQEARARGLDATDIEEFAGDVNLKMIARDYDVVRQFRGRSRITTYLYSVILHALRDYMDKRWGKWRPSRIAVRLGAQAVLVERLVRCQGCSVDDVVARLAAAGDPAAPETVLDIMARLPIRAQRRTTTDNGLESLPAKHGRPDAGIEETERQRTARLLEAQLDLAIARLSPGDRILLHLAFVKGRSIPDIAAIVGGSPRSLYSRLQKCKSALRRELEASGVDLAAVRAFLDEPSSGLGEVNSLRRGEGDGGKRPSHPPGRKEET